MLPSLKSEASFSMITHLNIFTHWTFKTAHEDRRRRLTLFPCHFAQVRRLRRRVPRRVPAEGPAVPSLRPPRAPPQDAVLLLVARRRQPRLLLPALPRHLRATRSHKVRSVGPAGQNAGQEAFFPSDFSACDSGTEVEEPQSAGKLLSYCDEKKKKKKSSSSGFTD